MDNAIEINNVSKNYKMPSLLFWKPKTKIEALNNVSFKCEGKKITCLLGPNGAGKTTVIKILAGLIIPDAGTIEIYNKPFIFNTNKQQFNIGLVTPNERSFYWRLTGRQNLEFYGSLYGLKGKSKNNIINEIISDVNLTNDADKPYRLYSAGMKQKLLLARALLSNPDILLLDEPTAHIDPIAQEGIHALIKEQIINKRNAAVLLCTHDLYETQKLADKIILLDKGKIIADGALESLRSEINYCGEINLEFNKMPGKGWEKNLPVEIINQGNKKIDIAVKNFDIIPDIIKSAVMNGGKLLFCHKKEESILDVFSRLSRGEKQ